MASTDWTQITDGVSGSSSIIDDSGGGAPSATSLRTMDAITYQNITGGAITDTQVVLWIRENRINAALGSGEVALRSQDTLYDTGTKYTLETNAGDAGGATLRMRICRWNAGVITQLQIFNVTTGSRTAWQKWRFGCITSGSNVLLRLEWWNGASWDVVCDTIDASADRITSAGSVRIGNCSTNGDEGNTYFDDVEINSLA